MWVTFIGATTEPPAFSFGIRRKVRSRAFCCSDVPLRSITREPGVFLVVRSERASLLNQRLSGSSKKRSARCPLIGFVKLTFKIVGGNWKFHMILADVQEPFLAYRRQETDATGWFTRSDMSNLLLHPGLKIWLSKAVSSNLI